MRVLALLLITVLNCYAQTEWDLTTCIDYALEYHVNVLRQQEDLELADNIYKLSKMDWLPTLNAEYNRQISSSKSLNANSDDWEKSGLVDGNMQLMCEQTLFDGGYTYHSIKQNQYLRQKSHMQLEQVKNNIILSVLQAYTDVLYYMENLDIAQKQLDLLIQQQEHVKKLVDKGLKSEIDLLEMQARIEKEKSQVETSQINYSNQILELKKEMGYPKAQDMKVLGLNWENILEFHVPSSDSLYILALSHLPGMSIIENEIRSDRHNLAAIKSNYYPKVTIAGNVSSWFEKNTINLPDASGNYSSISQINKNRSSKIILTLSIPIFNKTQIIQSQYKVNSAIADNHLQEIEYKNNLKMEIEKLCNNATMAKNQYLSLEHTYELYDKLYKSRTIQYNKGVLTFLDFITAKNNMEAVEIELLKSKYKLFYYNQLIDYYAGNGIYFTN